MQSLREFGEFSARVQIEEIRRLSRKKYTDEMYPCSGLQNGWSL